jgi:hypothetical protein
MKKIILSFLFASLVALTGYSQMSLSLSDSTGPIPNNSTVTYTGNSTTDEIVAYAFVTNNGTDPVPVKVKKVELYTLPGVTNVFCWGLCFAPSVYISTTTITIDPGDTDSLDFTGHVMPGGVSGYTLMRYVFFDESHTTDSVCFNVYFSHFPLSVGNILDQYGLSAAYPNPASGSVGFDVDLPSGSTGKIIIRNVVGNVVRELQTGNSQGKVQVDVSDLADGIYFYSLLVDGKTQATKKLVVRH